MFLNKKYLYTSAFLIGPVIGVGLFSLPYITSKVGVLTMLSLFLFVSSIVILINLFFGELALKTADFKRLPGFAKVYLGKWGQRIAFLSTIVGAIGAILAYLIIGGRFLTQLLYPIFNGSNLFYTFIYFILGSILIFLGVKSISKIQFIGLILLLLILILMFGQSHSFLKIENFLIDGSFSMNNVFLAYTTILFSLWGASLIPQAEEMLIRDKKMLIKIIPLVTIIPALVYLIFIFIVLGISGAQTTESGLIGLQNFLENKIVNIGLFLGLITTFTSFIAVGLVLKEIFWYDLKIKKHVSSAITCLVPFSLFLFGFTDFVSVISLIGAVTVGISGTLILLMYLKIRPERKFIVYPLVILLLSGIVYKLISIIL